MFLGSYFGQFIANRLFLRAFEFLSPIELVLLVPKILNSKQVRIQKFFEAMPGSKLALKIKFFNKSQFQGYNDQFSVSFDLSYKNLNFRSFKKQKDARNNLTFEPILNILIQNIFSITQNIFHLSHIFYIKLQKCLPLETKRELFLSFHSQQTFYVRTNFLTIMRRVDAATKLQIRIEKRFNETSHMSALIKRYCSNVT